MAYEPVTRMVKCGMPDPCLSEDVLLERPPPEGSLALRGHWCMPGVINGQTSPAPQPAPAQPYRLILSTPLVPVEVRT